MLKELFPKCPLTGEQAEEAIRKRQEPRARATADHAKQGNYGKQDVFQGQTFEGFEAVSARAKGQRGGERGDSVAKRA